MLDGEVSLGHEFLDQSWVHACHGCVADSILCEDARRVQCEGEQQPFLHGRNFLETRSTICLNLNLDKPKYPYKGVVEVTIKWTEEKLELLRDMLTEGMTFQQCGDHFGVSRSSIYLVRKKYFPDLAYGRPVREKKRAVYTDDLVEAQKKRFFNKKWNNSRKEKWDFEIEPFDIEYPSHCPVLGVELDWMSLGRRTENSPSFDRIDPSKGYIPGNVAIISWRANRIKNDGTADEHQKIANWISATLCNAS
jgi:predicted DNA-binding protein (UPF0251 family)